MDTRTATELGTLPKLYLELANIVPEGCLSSRELALKRAIDIYGLALLMIREGAQKPQEMAERALMEAGVSHEAALK